MTACPAQCKTLPELLEWAGRHSPGQHRLVAGDETCSWGEILYKSRLFAAQLMLSGLSEGERVLVLVPNSAEFFIAFYGVMISGGVAVPVYPGAALDRCSQLLRLCGGTHIVLPEKTDGTRLAEFECWTSEKGIQLHLVSRNPSLLHMPGLPVISPDDTAFIQYTSGSTGFPKGIPLTHNNLLENIRQMAETMKVTPEDVFVSWLPVYHDMGLILNTMVPLSTGATLVLLTEGLHNPATWLRAVEKYRGTFISAPDLAYRLCARSVRLPHYYDLSSLRVALNASEPVHPETYRLFEETFNLKNVMVSGYGLAEATLAVTMHPPGQSPVIDEYGYLSSGKPLNGVDIKIDPLKGQQDELRSGEILIKSDTLMKGYYDTQIVMQPFNKEGFLHTGDIGYTDSEGNLFVVARIKNIIIQGGMTLYPDDVEQVVMAWEGIRRAMAAGIESGPGEGERLFVFAEYSNSKCTDVQTLHQLAVNIVKSIYDHFGIRPARFFLLKPKSLPMTPNGKMQYFKLKEEYLNRSDRLMSRILYPVLKNLP